MYRDSVYYEGRQEEGRGAAEKGRLGSASFWFEKTLRFWTASRSSDRISRQELPYNVTTETHESLPKKDAPGLILR